MHFYLLMDKDFIIIIIRNAGFWHSGWLFALLQMPSLQNLKEFLGGLPFKPNVFSFDSPIKAIFFLTGPPEIPPAPLPDKKRTTPTVVC